MCWNCWRWRSSFRSCTPDAVLRRYASVKSLGCSEDSHWQSKQHDNVYRPVYVLSFQQFGCSCWPCHQTVGYEQRCASTRTSHLEENRYMKKGRKTCPRNKQDIDPHAVLRHELWVESNRPNFRGLARDVPILLVYWMHRFSDLRQAHRLQEMMDLDMWHIQCACNICNR